MTNQHRPWAPATLQVHAGYTPGELQNTATVPIYQSAAYEFESFAAARDIFALRKTGNLYSRTGNPTNSVLEKRVAALDGGVGALATASGQSAVAIALLALVRGGQHIVASSKLYGGTVDLLADTFADFGIGVTFADPGDVEAWSTATTDATRAWFVESIGNPTASLPDLRALATAAHRLDVPLVVDNTVATPVLQRPIENGADVVVYSATKFLGGHGNSLGGVIVDGGSFDFGARPERWTQFTTHSERFGITFLTDLGDASPYLTYAKAKLAHDLGPALSPFNAFLLLQGLETLDLRIARHGASALLVAEHLARHPLVATVHHAGLPDHPDYAIGQRDFPHGTGSVFAFDLAADESEVGPFIDRLQLFSLVANIGDARSLVVHPATTTHSRFTAEQRAAAGISLTTIRLSIGLEDPADLIDDLDGALAAVKRQEVAA
ncbi:MAG: PLP-dependent transferase [Rhodoglobus sp.]